MLKNLKFIKTVKNGLKHCNQQSKLTKSENSYYKNDIHDIGNYLLDLRKKFFFLSLQFSLFLNSLFRPFLIFGHKYPKIKKSVQKTAQIIKLPYYLSHFIKKIHLLTLTFFLGPLTWNRR